MGRIADNGREFCGRPDRHPYELFLQLEEIEHRTTTVRRPQSNGFIERFHRTLLDEHLRIAGRTKWYETLEEMQGDCQVITKLVQPVDTPPLTQSPILQIVTRMDLLRREARPALSIAEYHVQVRVDWEPREGTKGVLETQLQEGLDPTGAPSIEPLGP
jgi:transposase InsO family protein